MKKIFVCFLMIAVLLININVDAYAISIPDHDFNYDSLESYWKLLQDVGFIVSFPAFETGRSIGSIVKKFLNDRESGSGDSIISNEDGSNWAKNNITINGDGNIVLNDDAKQFINFLIKDTIENSDPYVTYSFNLFDYTGNFATPQVYDALVSLCETYQDSYQIIKFGNNNQVCLLPVGQYAGFYYLGSDIAYRSNVYSLSNWNGTPNEDDYRYFVYQNGVYVEQSLYKTPLTDVYSQVPGKVNGNNIGSAVCYISAGTNYDVLIFRDLSNLRSWSKGHSPYYFNNQVYRNYSNSVGDYTITNDNSNKVNIGDINTFIDDHHTETGEYPSSSEINVFIDNYLPETPTPNPDNPSGGGSFVNNNNPSFTNNPTFNNNPNINITLFPSVSDNGLNGGTVSGNGGNGSIGSIFDWIGYLGNVIAALIKNVGEMIVNALQGVVEAVTTILSGIPNILSPIIEFVFGGLPDKVQDLVILGISCIIFVGIIKVLKR